MIAGFPYRATGIKMAIVGAAMATASLVGCSNAMNDGGDTRCHDFLSQDESTQSVAVSKMLKGESGTQNDPAELQISASRVAVLTYCKTLGNENSKISEAPHL